MSDTLVQIKSLVAIAKVRISVHAYDELAADGIHVRDLIKTLPAAELLKDYPEFPK